MSISVQQKFLEVMKGCSYIQKLGKNDFHGYNYVTSADVLEKVNDALCEVGLTTNSTVDLLDFREIENAKGNKDKHAIVKVTITITDIETGEFTIINGIGSGQDSGDKAIMKAETAAIKYAYMLSLCIATGDDPEADSTTGSNTTTNIFTSQKQEVKRRTSSNASPVSNISNVPKELQCIDCGARITEKVHSFSNKRYGMALCMHCQKAHNIA